MNRKIFLLGWVPGIFFQASSQNPGELLDRWSAKTPIEKVYLHFDRENYIAGETAWFKAYLYSDYQPDTITTTLYAELVDDKGNLVKRSIVPVLMGTANGHFELPDSLYSGYYSVRSYSPTILNQIGGQGVTGDDFISRKNIFIYGKKNKTAIPPIEKKIRLEFFPEGGNLITGLANTVAFKATDEKGLPVAVKGKLISEKNEMVAEFTSYHDGLGLFELTPLAGEKYYAVTDNEGTGAKHYLPGQTENGIALTVIPHPQGHFFELKQRKDNPAFQASYMIGQMQHHVVFRQDFKTFKEEIQGVINTQDLHAGILQITFFNKDNQPLAERLCFVSNKKYIQQGKLIVDTVNFSAKARNRFSIQLEDTVQGSFSISITDPDYSLSAQREENIFSTLLLTSDLKGYIHNPAYYFSGDNDSISTALDLVMMTNGWRRFKWSEIYQKTTTPAYKDPGFITVSGKVLLRDTRKPFAEKPVLMMLITADSVRRMQMIITDKQGNFSLDSMLFFGRSRLFFSDIRGKKSQYIDVQLTPDSITKRFQLPPISIISMENPDQVKLAGNTKIDMDYDAIRRSKGIMMEGVTVKARKKSAIEELEEKYARGMFSGSDHKTIDLVSNPEAETYLTIFDYLQNRIPGLDFTNNEGAYVIYYRQTASASSMGPIPMIVYLDEIETDASIIATVPPNQIAMVKLFSSFAGAVGNAAGGALAIYTKKGSDLNDVMQHRADMVKYEGYSVIKEFYAPDYTVNKAAISQADNRITIDWRPDIFINNVNPRIPFSFYNNDRTKSYKVVVEGMTVDGKLLMIEKTISNAKDF